jgi:hypothetical protein
MGSVSCSEKEFQSYYVKELDKFISPTRVPVGAKLKHLSQIPGWSKTPVTLGYLLISVCAVFFWIHLHIVQVFSFISNPHYNTIIHDSIICRNSS